jgi:hypothetical protein
VSPPPADEKSHLRTRRTHLSAVARRLLVGVGVLIGFWAFGALAQAHADTLPARSFASHQPRPALDVTAHPLRQTVPHLLRTARRPVAPVRTTVERIRPVRLVHRLERSRLAEITKAADRPVDRLRSAARAHTYGSSGRQDDGDCHPPPPNEPPPSPQRVVPHAAGAAPALRGRPHGPVAVPDGVTPPQRMKPTGTITHLPRPRAERMALAAPMPAPISGSGESGGSGGKTSSGTGDVPRVDLPVSGFWTITSHPAVTVSRIIADKPSFSPD